MEKTLFAKELVDEAGLPAFAAKIRPIIEQANPFVLLLEGEMGSGKTTFVREFLQVCGLDADTPVMSPTYTIVNEYRLNKAWYAHLDLYRAEQHFSFDELGLTDLKEHRGFFIEWPQQADISHALQATHLLQIESSEDLDLSYRRYTLKSY
ncbi:MAG: tRNA (adenosine(37)-N6)-threonylcarbamoyltransferase complex ATPase subunit type 1 TsaE [Oligoflexus sp.]